MDFLLIFLSGVLDRIRGDKFHLFGNRIFDKIAYGWVISALIGHPFDFFTLGFIALFGVGMSPGWGGPMGCFLNDRKMVGDGEWWQKGILATNVHLALWFRGLMWGACILPLMYYEYKVVYVALSIIFAFPLSLYLCKQLFPFDPYKAWKMAEAVRGWMIAGYTYVFILFS